ncbi:MAG: hypothetical protein K6G94_08170, partial [Kiritimatiellae bacterium]|nr:hypothetical protein [Kiritimatiellia bacterium]
MKNIFLAMLAAVGMAWLVDAEAAAEMETRTYPVSLCFPCRFAEATEYAGLQSDDYDKDLADLLQLFGVDWPEGSGITNFKSPGTFDVKNTPENLAKFEKVMSEFRVDAVNIAIDVRFVETGRAALDAVGYFDTNRVDAAVLQERLLARGDVKLLDSVSAVTRPGEETVVKHVKEYIYPTDYDIFPCGKSADGTNSASRLFAAVEPQSFTMREAAGSIVQVTPSLAVDNRLIDLEFGAQLVGEPEWKDYGAKAKWEGAATYDLPMEQPFVPVRASVDAKVSMSPGGTLVFGGVTDSRMANEDKFVLVFVTARCIDGAGETCAPPSHRADEPEVWRKYESEGMEAWAFMYVAPTFCCMPMGPDPAEKPKSPDEIAAERAKNIRESERNMMEFFAECAEAGWPEGSALHKLKPLNRMWIKNTPENLAKIARWWKKVYGPNDHVELDVRFISADRKTLVDAGYFSA